MLKKILPGKYPFQFKISKGPTNNDFQIITHVHMLDKIIEVNQ